MVLPTIPMVSFIPLRGAIFVPENPLILRPPPPIPASARAAIKASIEGANAHRRLPVATQWQLQSAWYLKKLLAGHWMPTEDCKRKQHWTLTTNNVTQSSVNGSEAADWEHTTKAAWNISIRRPFLLRYDSLWCTEPWCQVGRFERWRYGSQQSSDCIISLSQLTTFAKQRMWRKMFTLTYGTVEGVQERGYPHRSTLTWWSL